MYSDPVQALRAAYSAMATDTTVTTCMWKDMLGSVVKDTSDLSKWDRIAQGCFTISLAKKSASLYSRYLLEAVYYPPIEEFRASKELSCKMISYFVYENLQRRIDRWFINDQCRQYGGFKHHHSDSWWSQHIHRSDRQIRRYKSEKIMPILDTLHNNLIRDIEDPFIENGLIK